MGLRLGLLALVLAAACGVTVHVSMDEIQAPAAGAGGVARSVPSDVQMAPEEAGARIGELVASHTGGELDVASAEGAGPGQSPAKARRVKQAAEPLPYVAIGLAGRGGRVGEGSDAALAGTWERTDEERELAGAVAADHGATVRHQIGALAGWWLLEFPGADEAVMAEAALAADPRVVQALLQHRSRKAKKSNDTYFTNQWHLKNTGQGGRQIGLDINVEPAWTAGHGGLGRRVAVLDDGVDFTNPDLAASHYSAGSYDFENNNTNPQPKDISDDHGTPCAGLVGARTDNGIGVAAPANAAQISGLRMLVSNQNDAIEGAALGHMVSAFDVYSNSWGPSDTGDYEHPGPLAAAAFAAGIANGRAGRGAIYVWAGGNGGSDDNANYDGYANLPETISVPALTGNAFNASYSEQGACHLIAGMAGDDDVVSTDRVGNNGYNYGQAGNLSNPDYTNDFSGTSAATPMVSGVIAQMLGVNPMLTWRDVQHILVRSARKFNQAHSSWSTNFAGYSHSQRWGFGLVNSGAATALAQTWTNVPARQTISSNVIAVNQSIPETGPALSFTHNVTTPFHVEHVQVRVNISHTYWGDLVVTLTSPKGTVSTLAVAHLGDRNGAFTGNEWTYMTVRCWGEPALGNWTLTVADGASGDVGTLQNWRLILHGTTGQPGPNGGAGPPVVTTSTIPSPTVGVAYSTQFAASGGNGGPYQWSVESGSLPDGLTLSSGGLLSGTPTVTNTFQFTVRAQDSSGAGTQQFAVFVYGPNLSIVAPVGTTLPAAGVGKSYSVSLVSAGGAGTARSWSVAPVLPVGLSLSASTGVISGFPVNAGTTNHTFTVTDAASAQATRIMFLTVHPALAFTAPSGSSLPTASVGQQYVFSLGVSGGSGGARSFSVTPDMPPGMSLSASTGAITGTPTAAGTHSLTVTVSDEVSAPRSKTMTLEILAPLAIATVQLPAAAVGVPYSQTLAGTGGRSTTYAWSVSPALPAGLSLNAATGVVSGTAPAAGTVNCTFTLNDGVSAPASKIIPVVVDVPLPLFRAGTVVAAGSYGGGIPMYFTRTILNAGYGAGVCSYSLYASADGELGPEDFLLYSGSASVPAQGQVTVNQHVPLPLNVPAGTWRVGMVLTGQNVDPGQDRAVTPLASVVFVDALVRVEGGHRTVARQLNATVEVPVYVRNTLVPVAYHVEFTLSLGAGSVLVYDNHVQWGSANYAMPTVVVNPLGGGSYSVSCTSAFPFLSGELVRLRFRVAATPSAAHTMETLTATGGSVRREGTVVLSSAFTDCEVHLRDHEVGCGYVQSDQLPGSTFDLPVVYGLHVPAPIANSLNFRAEFAGANLETIAVLPGSAAVAAGISVSGLTGNDGADVTVTAPGTTLIPVGEVAIIRFRVRAGGSVIGSYPIHLNQPAALGPGTPGPSIPLGVSNDLVRIAPDSFSDVNGDGSIDVVDVQTTVNMILGLTNQQAYEFQGDANLDFVIDVVDVQTIVNCILSLGGCG